MRPAVALRKLKDENNDPASSRTQKGFRRIQMFSRGTKFDEELKGHDHFLENSLG